MNPLQQPSAIFMGSKPGSVVALRTLIARGWDIKYVVVSRQVAHPWIPGETLEECAKAHGIPVVTQAKLPLEPVDFVISYMFRYRVKGGVIALGRRASLNFHAGPLPEYGGWYFYNMAILNDATEYGCTCHYLDDGFDTGPLLKVARFPIHAGMETAWSLERRTQEEMIRLFVEFCDLAESGLPLPRDEQDRSRARYMSQEQFEALKAIPGDADEETVDRYARAFWYPPYTCAYTTIGETRVEVVPKIVKEQLASALHADDLERLARAAAASDARTLADLHDMAIVFAASCGTA
jgi:methionyl-tRNA formyltransferase